MGSIAGILGLILTGVLMGVGLAIASRFLPRRQG